MEEVVATADYSSIAEILWDHATSCARVNLLENNRFFLVEFPSSAQVEKQFQSLSCPPKQIHLGVFTGSERPKLFQRRRNSLAKTTPGKLSLEITRKLLAYQTPNDIELRPELIQQYIQHGYCSFPVKTGTATRSLVFDTEKLAIYPDDRTNDPSLCLFSYLYHQLASWTVENNSISFALADTSRKLRQQCIFTTSACFHIRNTLEYFLNMKLVKQKKPPIERSIAGREIMRVQKLSEAPAPALVLRCAIPDCFRNRMTKENDKFIEGVCSSHQAIKVASAEEFYKTKQTQNKSPKDIQVISRHFAHIVLHQGWLIKRGGLKKEWRRRFSCIYSTPLGHALFYYDSSLESPVFREATCTKWIDISSIAYIRPVSTDPEAAEFSFDIVTIYRTWTFCAESHSEYQRWLQMISRAVDLDMAIVPDIPVVYTAKAVSDPFDKLSRTDYTTQVRVGSNGLGVFTSSSKQPIYEWQYTNLQNWKATTQHGKACLYLTVFTDAAYKDTSVFVFRTKFATSLTLAIEFFIEKAMMKIDILYSALTTSTESPGAQEEPALINVEDVPPPPPVVEMPEVPETQEETESVSNAPGLTSSVKQSNDLIELEAIEETAAKVSSADLKELNSVVWSLNYTDGSHPIVCEYIAPPKIHQVVRRHYVDPFENIDDTPLEIQPKEEPSNTLFKELCDLGDFRSK